MSNITKIKLLPSWDTPSNVKAIWNKMSQDGKGKWNNLQLVGDNEECDYYIILNGTNLPHIPEKTILFPMEPFMFPVRQYNYMFCSPRMGIEWHLGSTYSGLSNYGIIKTGGNALSSIVSTKYDNPGQRFRIDFLRYLEPQDHGHGPILESDIPFPFPLHIYGNNTFRNYVSSPPYHNKNESVLPYKYHFQAENTSIKDYYTEKIIDCILGECLCFYWGCPNIEDWLDPMCYIRLPTSYVGGNRNDLGGGECDDGEHMKKCRNIIIEAINNNEWEKRIEYIIREKHRILNEMQFFPFVEKIIKDSLTR